MTCHILVVDDEPLSRRNIARFLERAGHKIREADTGEAAIDLSGVLKHFLETKSNEADRLKSSGEKASALFWAL